MPCRTRLAGLEVEGWGRLHRGCRLRASGGRGRLRGLREALVHGETVSSSTAPTWRASPTPWRPARGSGYARAAGQGRSGTGRAGPHVAAGRRAARRLAPRRRGRAEGRSTVTGASRRTLADVDDLAVPNCGALVSADADWCGQCFTSLRTGRDPSRTRRAHPCSPTGGAGAERRGRDMALPRRVATQNPIELDLCSVCGTSFGQLFREDEPIPTVVASRRVPVVPHVPGIGHAKAGRGPDGSLAARCSCSRSVSRS